MILGPARRPTARGLLRPGRPLDTPRAVRMFGSAGPLPPRRGAAPVPMGARMTPEEIAELRRRRYNGTVVYLHRANPELMILRVRPDFTIPPHQPGQYTTLGLGMWEPRTPGCQEERLREGDEKKLVR